MGVLPSSGSGPPPTDAARFAVAGRGMHSSPQRHAGAVMKRVLRGGRAWACAGGGGESVTLLIDSGVYSVMFCVLGSRITVCVCVCVCRFCATISRAVMVVAFNAANLLDVATWIASQTVGFDGVGLGLATFLAVRHCLLGSCGASA